MLVILFQNPNFLILDEPTNDLDLPTLGVLENFLSDFQGCVLIVSHDRYFMDRLVDHLFVFEGDGEIRDFPGNYSLYREWIKANEKKGDKWNELIKIKSSGASTDAIKSGTINSSSDKKNSGAKRNPTFNEKREFEILDKAIKALEAEKKKIEENLGSMAFQDIQAASVRIGELSKELEEKELKWLELSELM